MSPRRTLKEIDENFRFLVSEVSQQIEDVQELLLEPDKISVSSVETRDNYIDVLKSIIENKCFKRLRSSPNITRQTVDVIKAILSITSNLERIGDFAVNMGRQTRFLNDKTFFKDFNPKEFFDELSLGLSLIEGALFDLDTPKALRICRRELKLDDLYKEMFDRILPELKQGQGERAQNLVTGLFVFRYLERAGDSLLNIGEAVISAVMGERLKIQQYRALEESLKKAGNESGAREMSYRTLAETKSGGRIGLVEEQFEGDSRRDVIFKNGEKDKIKEEKEKIEKWEELVPGLPPKIYGYHVHRKDASLLLEALPGRTIQELILSGENEALEAGKAALFRVLSHTWSATRENKRSRAEFIAQLESRLGQIYKVHPEFNENTNKIGVLEIRSFENLRKQSSDLDKKLESPFSVFIHGDFNSDNILYDVEKDRINFIDLHRSRSMDYTQDITVFIVSNFRLPVHGSKIRNTINRFLLDFYRFSSGYAREQEDHTFDVRCALGLARSFITSTRFELNKNFAREMFNRGLYLLERVANLKDDSYTSFTLPTDIFTY